MNRNHLFIVALVLLITLGSESQALGGPRERSYDATHYRLEMTLDPNSTPKEFEAALQVSLTLVKDTNEIELDSELLSIKSITMQKPKRATLTFDTTESKFLKVMLPSTMKKGNKVQISIAYSGKINEGNFGLFKVDDPDDASRGALYFTHFEPTYARGFFPCNDQPNDKATSEVFITVPTKYQVVSNGKLVGDKKVKGKEADWHEVHWSQPKAQSTYLLSVAIAPFTKLTASKKGPEVSVWVGAAKAEKAKYVLESTQESLAFFEEYLGVKYPWDKYATIGIPTFVWGGMENTTATHMNEERILKDPTSANDVKRIQGLAAHELAHQWFGDYVTMKWWNDVWLNESFASYMAHLAAVDKFKSEAPAVSLASGTWDSYFRQDDGPRSHPIVEKTVENPADAFDSINYTKGENVLRMLSAYMGEDKFRKGVKLYLTSHKYGNATYTDLFDSLSIAFGGDLSDVRDSWLLQRGYPVITYGGKYDASSGNYKVTLAQHSNHAEDSGKFVFKIPVAFHRRTTPQFDKTIVVLMNKGEQAAEVSLPAAPEWVSLNAEGIIPGKVVPEVREESVLAIQASQDPDAVSRFWAAHNLSQGLYEGQSISSTAEKALVEVLKHDPSPYVRIALLERFQQSKSQWLPSRIGEAVLALAEASELPTFSQQPAYHGDTDGWKSYRTALLHTLGNVDSKKSMTILSKALLDPKTPLDDLYGSAFAMALIGSSQAAEVLKASAKVQAPRGYRFGYALQLAFGSYRSPEAAKEIRELSKTCRNDLMGRIGWAIRDNQPLKNSKEWAEFVRDFVLKETRFDDEVKSRILGTIEEVKIDYVRDMLRVVAAESGSDRIKEETKKILEKNFPKS